MCVFLICYTGQSKEKYSMLSRFLKVVSMKLVLILTKFLGAAVVHSCCPHRPPTMRCLPATTCATSTFQLIAKRSSDRLQRCPQGTLSRVTPGQLAVATSAKPQFVMTFSCNGALQQFRSLAKKVSCLRMFCMSGSFSLTCNNNYPVSYLYAL